MFNNNTKKLFASAILLLVSLFVYSCGVWTDFTTYFNTYYNARTLFDQVEDQILTQNTDPFVFREEEQPANQRNTQQQQPNVQRTQQPAFNTQNTNTGNTRPQTLSPTQINNDLTKVIEKCSKILQYEKESSYFDDALFMTGKAFYYQGEYARAQRKFLELAAVPQSDYALENKLWLAKTYLQLRNFDEGLNLLEEVKKTALEQEDEKLYESTSITKIGFLIYREEYQAAINECNDFLKNLDDDEMAALVWYQMGKIYLLQKDNENALKAFSAVLEHSPTFELEYESRLQHALLLKDLGKMDESEEELNDLHDEGKFNNQLDRTMVELGKIYYDKNDNEKAISTFMEVDSTYKSKPSSGMASFMLGQIYEKKFGAYDSAYKYYNKTVSSTAPYDTKLEAGNYVRNIDKYFTLRTKINDYQKSYVYATDPTRFMQDSIDYDLAYKDYMIDVRHNVDSVKAAGSQTRVALTDEAMEQQIKSQMQQAAVQQAKRAKVNREYTLKDLIVQGKAKKPEKPAITVDSLGTLLSQEYYNLAGLFFSELDIPDSAYYYYKEILDEYPDKPSTVPTLFALGTFYETSNENKKADSLYQVIYDNYPNSKLYKEAAIKLGKVKKDEQKVELSNDPAERDYIAAENLYYEKKYHDAISGLTHVYLTYPKSTFVPKALYFIGMIYEDNLEKNDSAAVYYGILASKEYASTPYGKAVIPKYDEYKKEQERIEKEKEEALKEHDKATIGDSTAVKENPADEGIKRKVIDEERLKRKIVDDEMVKPDSLNTKEERRKQLFRERLKSEKQDTTDSVEAVKQQNKKLVKDSTAVNKENPANERPKRKIVDDEIVKPDTLKNKDEQREQLHNEQLKTEQRDTTDNKKPTQQLNKKPQSDSSAVKKENNADDGSNKKIIDDDRIKTDTVNNNGTQKTQSNLERSKSEQPDSTKKEPRK